jgi:hypothetical protein
VTIAPWQYPFLAFTDHNFPDLSRTILYASLFWLAATIVIYNVRTRRLHGHGPYLDMYEWLLWTGLITFSLVIVYWVFQFDFFFVPITLAIGLGTLPADPQGVRGTAGEAALLHPVEVRPSGVDDPAQGGPRPRLAAHPGLALEAPAAALTRRRD